MAKGIFGFGSTLKNDNSTSAQRRKNASQGTEFRRAYYPAREPSVAL